MNTTPEPSEIEKRLEACQKERDEYLNGWKRAKADLINYQKEEGRRIEEVAAYATASLIKDLVLLIDSFDLAQNSLGDSAAKKGLELIANQFENVLRRHGAEKITAKPGDEFNPRLHEAVGEVELSEKALDGKIAELLSVGYQLKDRVLRPARVKLGKLKS